MVLTLTGTFHINLSFNLSCIFGLILRGHKLVTWTWITLCVHWSCIVLQSDSGTCLSRRCFSLSLWMALSCSGLIPFHLSTRTRGGLPPSTSISAASAHSVIISDVSVWTISARFSFSSLLCCSFSFSSRSAACGGTGHGKALPLIHGQLIDPPLDD